MLIEKLDEMIIEAVFLDSPPDLQAKLKEDLGFDSLSIVELIVNLEEEFNLQFNESDLDPRNIQTVEDIYQLLARYVEEFDDAAV